MVKGVSKSGSSSSSAPARSQSGLANGSTKFDSIELVVLQSKRIDDSKGTSRGIRSQNPRYNRGLLEGTH